MKNKNFVLLVLPLLALASCGDSNSSSPENKHTHVYDTENIDWCFVPTTSGGYSASATFTCHKCKEGTEGHEVEVPAGVTSEIVDPQCETDGCTIYTATAHFDENDYVGTKVVTIPMTGHEYDVTWNGDEIHHYKQCLHCDHKIDLEPHVSYGYKFSGAYHWKECEECHLEYAKEEHKVEEVVKPELLAQAATCYSNEKYYKSCSVCEHTTEFIFEKAGTMLSHDFSYHAAVTPKSCVEPGNKAYYICSHCPGKFFLSDDDPHALPVDYSFIIDTVGHDMIHHTAKEPTCDENGIIDCYQCQFEADHKYYADEAGTTVLEEKDVIIQMTGHDFNENNTCNKCSKTITEALGLTPTSSTTPNTNELVLSSDSGMIYGKKTMTSGAKMNLPSLKKDGYTMIGWFDGNGKQVFDGDEFEAKISLVARFIQNNEQAMQPSDFGLNTHNWYTLEKPISRYSPNSLPSEASRLDLYFLINVQSSGTGDTYTIFGFPAENSGYTTIYLRLDTSDVTTQPGYAHSTRTYFYSQSGSSIGGAGESTKHYAYGVGYLGQILVHMYIIPSESKSTITAGYELTSMANGTKFSFETPVTFASGHEYNFASVDNNMFLTNRGQDKSSYMIKDVF